MKTLIARTLLGQYYNPHSSKQLKISLPNVSIKLRDMSKTELVECINPDDAKGRIYKLTDKGKDIIKEIKKMESS